MLYACKGVPGSVKAGNTEHSLDIYGESYELPTPFSPVRERDKEREREIKKERERKMMAALKGMTGALAPFSYLVL
jgi:hypothetical protein